MKDEYYRLRGWDVVTGLQVEKVVEAMGKGEPVNPSDKVSVFRDDGLRPCGSASGFVCAKAFTLLLLLISPSH